MANAGELEYENLLANWPVFFWCLAVTSTSKEYRLVSARWKPCFNGINLMLKLFLKKDIIWIIAIIPNSYNLLYTFLGSFPSTKNSWQPDRNYNTILQLHWFVTIKLIYTLTVQGYHFELQCWFRESRYEESIFACRLLLTRWVHFNIILTTFWSVHRNIVWSRTSASSLSCWWGWYFTL